MTDRHKAIFRTAAAVLAAALLTAGCSGIGSSEKAAISEKYRVPGEKQLIVYTSHKEEVYLPIIREFENRTGIWVEIHSGGTAQMFEEARAASENGACDILFGGGIETYEAQKDLFIPYECSDKDRLDPEYTSPENLWTPFTELPLVFVYNSKLVPEQDAPRTWAGMFDEKWKGQIAFADLHSSGTSYTILSTYGQITGRTPTDFFPSFAELIKGRVLDSSGQIVPAVSNGTYLVGITLEETAMKGILEGYDIAMVYPEDGTSTVPDGCAMVVNSPHSYNAGLFIDFVVGGDTQKYAMDTFCRRSVRTDIPAAESFGGITRADFDIARSAREEDYIFGLWDLCFGEGR